MSRTFPLRLPESIKRMAEDLARAGGVSLNQFIATAVAEQVSALNAATYLRSRAAGADRARFDEVLVASAAGRRGPATRPADGKAVAPAGEGRQAGQRALAPSMSAPDRRQDP